MKTYTYSSFPTIVVTKDCENERRRKEGLARLDWIAKQMEGVTEEEIDDALEER